MSAARDIALALAGGRRPHRLPNGGYLVPCPVPSHGKGRGDSNPSLHIGDGASRLLVHCYAGCDPRDVLDVLRRRGLLENCARSEYDRHPVAAQNGGRGKQEHDERARKRIRQAREIWSAARDPRGTLAEVYLRFRRLTLNDVLAGHVLRFHPRCPWLNESGERIFVPALIAVFRSIDNDEVTGIQRIALKSDGHKLGRRMLGVVHRAAVKLDSVEDELAIGEGVETCMAAHQLMVMGELERAAVWALGSAGGIERFPVLPNINTLRIIGENDHTNERAVEQCGLRWQAAGRCVRVIKPDPDCKDLNDVLEGRAP